MSQTEDRVHEPRHARDEDLPTAEHLEAETTDPEENKNDPPMTDQPEAKAADGTHAEDHAAQKAVLADDSFDYIVPQVSYKEHRSRKHSSHHTGRTKSATKEEMDAANEGYVFTSMEKRGRSRHRHRSHWFRRLPRWKRVLIVVTSVILALVLAFGGTFLILREIGRGGQVYFLYNRVRSIESFYARLRALVPEARIGVAHGQMKEHALEDVMMDFYAGSYDVLLCTTIIESGLDVPSANTLIVYDAERFGLSQLYQLRGRVGRSSRQAYAYFTVRTDRVLSETARQRLEAIREFTEFGAGFRIAMRDLEIRGAGNILGPEQHGHLAAVGYDMYCRLMEETLLEVGEGTPPRDLDTRVDLRVDAYLPETYIADEKQRMEMYKRIASIGSEADRAEVLDELIDRYGDVPAVVETLLDVSQLRAMCNALGISQVSRGRGGAVFRLEEKYIPDPARLMQAMIRVSPEMNFARESRPAIVYRTQISSDRELLRELLKLIRRLTAEMETLTEKKEEA